MKYVRKPKLHIKLLILLSLFVGSLAITTCVINTASDYVTVVHADDDDGKEAKDIMPDVTAEVAGNPKKYNLQAGNPNAIAGNQWAQICSTNNLFGQSTQNSFSLSYQDLLKSKNNKQEGQAAAYGYVLKQTGLDHTIADGFGDVFLKAGRLVGGGLTYIGYGISSLVANAWKIITKIMLLINPLEWMSHAQSVPQSSPMYPVANLLYKITKGVQGIGYVGAIIVFIVTIGFAFMGFRVSEGNTKVGVVRGLFQGFMRFFVKYLVIIGLPLMLASVISASMKPSSELLDGGGSASSYAIYSNLVNYEEWMQHSRLALPQDLQGKLESTSSAKGVNPVNHRQILAVNSEGANITVANQLYNELTSSSLGTGSDGGFSDPFSKKENQVKHEITDTPLNMLNSWTTFQVVGASDWSSYTRANMPENVETKDSDKLKDELLSKKDGKYKYVNNGSLQVNGDNKFTSKVATYGSTSTHNLQSDQVGGISTIGMYNYQSTIFNDGNIEWISGTKSTNKFTIAEHASVGLAGKGFSGLGNYMIMEALIWCSAILGAFILFSIINASIVSVPKLGAYGFVSSLGSFKGAIKLITAVSFLLIQVVGGWFFYLISTYLLRSLAILLDNFSGNSSSGLTRFLASKISMNTDVSASVLGNTTYGTMSIFVAVFLMFMTFQLLKARGTVLNGMAEMVENSLNRIWKTFEHGTGGAGDMPTPRMSPNGGGLETTNSDGSNKMGKFNDDTGQGNVRSGNSYGDMSSGQMRRRNSINNPQSLIGHGFNASQNNKDIVDAAEKKKGMPLTKGEKAKAIAGTRMQKMGESIARTVGAGGIADDLEQMRNARVNDSFRNPGEQGENYNSNDKELGTNEKFQASEAESLYQKALNNEEFQNDQSMDNFKANAAEAGDATEARINTDGYLTDNMNQAVTDQQGNAIKAQNITSDDSGYLTDASGQPILNSDKERMNIASDQSMQDSSGYLTDVSGQRLTDSIGNQLKASDVTTGNHGEMLDSNDQPITDSNGNIMKSMQMGSDASNFNVEESESGQAISNGQKLFTPSGKPIMKKDTMVGQNGSLLNKKTGEQLKQPNGQKQKAQFKSNNSSTQQRATSIPNLAKSVQRSNQEVKSATANYRKANQIAGQYDKNDKSEAAQQARKRVQQAGNNLQNKRVQSMAIMNKQRTPKAFKSSASFRNKPLPNMGQTKKYLDTANKAQQNVINGTKSGNQQLVNDGRQSLKQLKNQMRDSGLDTKMIATPKDTRNALNNWKNYASNAANGQMNMNE